MVILAQELLAHERFPFSKEVVAETVANPNQAGTDILLYLQTLIV